MKRIYNLFILALFCLTIKAQTIKPGTIEPVDYVNTLIGTAPLPDKEYLGNNPAPGEELYSGTVNPGAMVPEPNGKVCAGPVSGYDGQRYHVRGSGYRFYDTTIMGFTNLNGEYHDANKLLFMPTIGNIKTIPGSRANPFEGYRSAKDTLREKGLPGYYTVFLTTYGIKVELTATKNCGFHRYTFPASKHANILLDLANSQPYAVTESVNIIDNHTIEGYHDCGVDTVYHITGSSRIYFHAVFSKDFTKSGTWLNGIIKPGSISESGNPVGAYATFTTKTNETILVKIGTSTVSIADASDNLTKEISNMDFDAIRKQTQNLWSNILNNFSVEGGSEGDRTNFYTAIYRSRGYSRGGVLPQLIKRPAQSPSVIRGTWGGGYWGTGSVGGVVGSYKQGINDVDIKAAYQKFLNDAMNGGGKAGAAYRQYGYIPSGVGVDDYVNRTIGLSYDDYAMSELAKIVGDTSNYNFFLKRSKNYKNLFNTSTGFFTPRKTDGSWILPLNPFNFHAEDIYREGNAWNYLWFNCGDISGLIELLGGKERFIAKLDTFFTKPLPNDATPLRDCSGIIGMYCHGNEQYRNIPYYYNYVGQPWKTQAIVRKIQKVLYRPTPVGMCGMDDYGNLESWYAASAMGFNQANRASEYFEIGSPLFPKVTITLDGGKFIIQANNVSDKNMYIQSAKLNGKPLNLPRFRIQDMIPEGSLVFEMGPKPNKSWGISSLEHDISKK